MKFNATRYSQPAVDLMAKVGIQLRRKSPEILAGVGVLTFIGTIYSAVKATPKIEQIKADAHEKLERVDEVEAKELEEYTHEDAQKDRGVIKVQTAGQVVKAIAPTVGLGALTLGCFFGSNYILRKRNIALSAVAVSADKAFKEYRKEVAKRFGDEVEQELRYGLVEKEYETEVTDDKGKTKTKKEKVKAADKAGYLGQFDFYFDETVPGWEKNANYNKTFVLQRQDWANKELKRRYYAFHQPLTVNDIRDMFNVERVPEGNSAVFWYDPNDPECVAGRHINFKIFDVHSDDNRAFVNGLERSVRICLEPDTLDAWGYVS